MPDGVKIKPTFFCPKNAPAAIADGYKLHFALEMRVNLRAIYKAQQHHRFSHHLAQPVHQAGPSSCL